jgi:AFG3 family protein
MFKRIVSRLSSHRLLPLHRLFSSNEKPPKGFEKFFKRTKDEKPTRKPEEPPKKNPGHDPKKPEWRFDPKFNPKDPKFLTTLALGACGAIGAAYMLKAPSDSVPETSMQELIKNFVEAEVAKKIVIKLSKTQEPLTEIVAIGTDDTELVKVKVPDLACFLKTLETEQLLIGRERSRLIPVEYSEKSPPNDDIIETISKLVNSCLHVAIFSTLLFVLFKSAGRSNRGGSGGSGGGLGDLFNMSKPNFKTYDSHNKTNVTFKDVAGLNEAKREIMEFVEFLKNPEKFQKLGARIPRGALLVGPPGTGKTLMAKATAGEANVPFFSIAGSDFVEMFVGVGASRVRQLFKHAKERAPSIIFIDEIDAVGRKRFGRIGGNDERDNTLNQLLVEMDGFTTDTHVVVMAGTNRKDILDSALLRPGRFDRTIELLLPDLEGREEIFKVHLKPIKLNSEHTLTEYATRLAGLTPGFSGADIENLCNEAAIVAARTNKESVDMEDFDTATERVIGGLEKGKKLSCKEKNVVAHHESGHAVAGWFLEGADPVLKVSILPRSKGALGFAQFLPSETHLHSKEELIDKICAVLGGRVAEELFFGKVTTGASDDLQKATQIAQAIVTSFGMNDRLGVVGYQYDQEAFNKPFSEDTSRIIDEEVRKIVNKCLDRTRSLLTSKKELVDTMAKALVEKERLTHRDLVEILGERPWGDNEDYQRYVQEQAKVKLSR